MIEAGIINAKDTGQFHGKAVLYLTNCDDQTYSSLGTSLNDNRLLRNGADYEMARLDVEKLITAKIMIEDVSTQLKKIDDIRSDPHAVKRLASQIKAYKLKIGDRG